MLAKDDVGRAKQLSVKLPPKEFIYGKAESKDEANVGVLTSNWISHAKSNAKNKNVVDFKKLNKFTTQDYSYVDGTKDTRKNLKDSEKFKMSRH